MPLGHVKHNLLAILGPTNTGKTHFAFERLTSYQSGIFGFPLRLLARENYDKAIAKLGVNITRKPGPMKHGTRVIAFCEDPDGYKVELNEPIKI